MPEVHKYIGEVVVGLFTLFWVWAAIARMLRKPDPGTWYWRLMAACQVVAGVQALGGIVLLIMGLRPTSWLHYVYGFGPIVALVLAQLYARRDPDANYPYMPFLFAGFVAFGLSLRALMTGLGL